MSDDDSVSIMELEEVKGCLRALLSSSPLSYSLNSLLNDFKNSTGFNLPLFGHQTPVDFLRSLNDILQLSGSPYNPEISLIESDKSSHIISLVEGQKLNKVKTRNHHFETKQRRRVVPLEKIATFNTSNKNSNLSFRPNSTGVKESGEGKMKNSSPLNSPNSQNFSCNALETRLRNVLKLPETNFYTSIPPKPSSEPPVIDTLQNGEPKNWNPFLSQINLIPLQNQDQVNKAPLKLPESKKTDIWYFEDISDNENSLSTDQSRFSSGAVSVSSDFINSGIKDKLKRLIKNYPNGLWCCDLPELFFEKYNFVLDFREFGYTSLIQMLSELPDVFRCLRPGKEDWILFDASVAPTPEEKKILNFQEKGSVFTEIRANMQKLFARHSSNSSSVAIELDKLPELYQRTFGTPLDVQSLGFKDVKSLLETFEGSVLKITRIGEKFFCEPRISKSFHLPVPWEEALPPITAESDIFVEIFPAEVVGPEEKLSELDLTRHIAVGHVVEVCIAEVWSPSKFFLQLNKYKDRLNRFMDEMQKFYNVHLSKYKMPDTTIRSNQVCVGLYTADPEFPDEWHRARIIKVINERTVLIDFVDYGTVTRVKKSQLRFLHRSFQSFPIQAFRAQLSGVCPPNDEEMWPMTTSQKFLELLRVPYLNAEMVEIDFEKPSLSVILTDPFQKSKASINKKLVLENLAKVKGVVKDLFYLQEELLETSQENNVSSGSDSKKSSEYSSSASVQENDNFSKSLPEITDQFRDVDDLTHSTLFRFKMNSSTVKPASSSKERKENLEEVEVTFEFKEIPELIKNGQETEAEAKKRNSRKGVNIKEVPTKAALPSEEKETSKSSNFAQLAVEKSLTNSLYQISTAEAFLKKPKRLPPGLECVNPLSDFADIPLLLQPECLKRRINLLAMELLTKNESIKEVGVNDPRLALKIATEMAEAYISSQVSINFPMCYDFYSFFPHGFADSSLPKSTSWEKLEMGADSLVPRESSAKDSQNAEADLQKIDWTLNIAPKEEPSPTSAPNMELWKEYVEVTEIAGKSLHLVKVDGDLYICAEELVRQFTGFSNRVIADRVLQIRKVKAEYRVISKKSDNRVLQALKSGDLPGVKRREKSKKLKIYLLQVTKAVKFLEALGCLTKTFEDDVAGLRKNWEERKGQEEELSK